MVILVPGAKYSPFQQNTIDYVLFFTKVKQFGNALGGHTITKNESIKLVMFSDPMANYM